MINTRKIITTITKAAVTEASEALVVLLQDVKENKVNIIVFILFIQALNNQF